MVFHCKFHLHITAYGSFGKIKIKQCVYAFKVNRFGLLGVCGTYQECCDKRKNQSHKINLMNRLPN